METQPPFCCEHNVSLQFRLPHWQETPSCLQQRTQVNFSAIHSALIRAVIPPAWQHVLWTRRVKMPAEMREETKEIISRDLLLSHQPPPPQYMPVDMKPIILMGTGSIHLNTALHMMTTMTPRATCHQLQSFLAASLEKISREKSSFFFKATQKYLYINLVFNPTVNYLSAKIYLLVSVHPCVHFHHPWVPILSFP